MLTRTLSDLYTGAFRSVVLTATADHVAGHVSAFVDAVIAAAEREGISFDDVAEMDEAAVYVRLFPGRGKHQSVYAQPDWDRVHRELARVGVTLKLLHSEYRDAHQVGGAAVMGYDRFCKTYHAQKPLVA